MKLWEKLKAAYNGKDCKTFDEAIAELKAKDEDSEGGTAVHVHTGEGRSAYDDDTLKDLFEKNETEHKAMDERMAACEGMMKTANDAKAKDEEEKKKKEEEQKAKDAEKEKEEKEIKDALADEAPAGEEEKAKSAKDSSFLVESFQQTKAKAELIAPGIQFPAFDKAASAKDTYKSICDLRRRAIMTGARDTGTLALILSLQGKKAFDSDKLGKMHCSQVKTLFDSLAEMKRLANNAAANKEKPDTNSLLNPANGIMDAENFKSLRDKARKERGQKLN